MYQGGFAVSSFVLCFQVASQIQALFFVSGRNARSVDADSGLR